MPINDHPLAALLRAEVNRTIEGWNQIGADLWLINPIYGPCEEFTEAEAHLWLVRNGSRCGPD